MTWDPDKVQRLMTESQVSEVCKRINDACPRCATRKHGLDCLDCTSEQMKALYGVQVIPDHEVA